MGTNCGTPSYTCPEQIAGKDYIGSAADIWSLGVIFFAMVAGFLPFEAASIPLLFKRIRQGQYRPPDYISQEARDLIARMLTVDPDKRATIAELRSHPWMLMEYTELIERIEAMEDVSDAMIEDAHAACQAWTLEEEKKASKDRDDDRRDKERQADRVLSDRPKDDTKEDSTVFPAPSAAHNAASSSSSSSSSQSLSPFSPPLAKPATGDGAASDASPLPLPSNGRPTPLKPRALYRDRDGGKDRSASRSPSIFDKLSIRTAGAQKGPNRRTTGDVLSPNSGSGSGVGSAGQGSGSAKHRKTTSLASLAATSPVPLSPGLSAQEGRLLAVRELADAKASTAPLRFPPISPTAGAGLAPLSASPFDDSPAAGANALNGRHGKPRGRPGPALEEKERDPAILAVTAIKPALTARRKGNVINPLTQPSPSPDPAPHPDSKPSTRRSSIDTSPPPLTAAAAGGGATAAYMGETTASRHRLLGKLNVDLSS